ncbi:hypothetical protein [Vibrio diabolicus]|uniref:hypothetical protein n=1 Tax=Vibrio diabolicus TaxID=50719 RepID=UPI003753984D
MIFPWVISSAHIGVDSLGRHRSGNVENNSLKSKEYIMRGLPILKSHVDRSIDSYDFAYTTSSDEREINLQKVIDYFFDVKYSPDYIRSIGRAYFSWDIQMKTVVKEAKWNE